MTTRRTFLGGMAAILASGMAPASARSGVLMPIRTAIIVPPTLRKWLLIESTWTEATLWTTAQYEAASRVASMTLESMKSPGELMSPKGLLVSEKDRTCIVVNQSLCRGQSYDFTAMNFEPAAPATIKRLHSAKNR